MKKRQLIFIITNGLYLLAFLCFMCHINLDLLENPGLDYGLYVLMFSCFIVDAILMCFVPGFKVLTWAKSIVAFVVWNIGIPGFVRQIMGILSENYEGSRTLEDTISIIMLALGFVVLIMPHFKIKSKKLQ